MVANQSMEDFLQQSYLEYARKRGRMVSAAEFAKYLGVPNTSLSQWMNGQREPVGDNVHRLAAKLGPKVYTILGLPPAMPDDPLFRKLAEQWFDLSEESQRRVMRFVEGEASSGEENTAVSTS